MIRRYLSLSLFILFFAITKSRAEPQDYRWGLGLNYIGGQVRYNLSKKWAGELRYLTGSENTDTGTVDSSVIGLRGYRFYRNISYFQLFLGGEIAYVNSEQKSTAYKTSGMATGGFGGLEYSFARRFTLGLDLGPYLVYLKEDTKDVAQSSLEFVLNSYLTFYLF